MRFLWHLPRRWKGWFAAAGAIYVGGAVGVELLGGLYASQYDVATFAYALITTVEEGLEMLGVVLFLYAILGLLQTESMQFHVRLTGGGTRSTAGDKSGETEDRGATNEYDLAASPSRP